MGCVNKNLFDTLGRRLLEVGYYSNKYGSRITLGA